MHRIRHFVLGILIFALGIGLASCGTRKSKARQPQDKLALVKSGRGTQPRVWYHFAQSGHQVTATSAVSAVFVLQNGKATTYMLPTGKHHVTLRALTKMSPAKQLTFVKQKDHDAFKYGVADQQAIVTNSIHGIKSDIKSLQKSKSDPTQIKALQQYLKINQAIRANPSSYTKPEAYPLTASRQGKGEQFGLKLYPVKTVQYGDANVIMANEMSLSNFAFRHRVQPYKINGRYFAGYRANVPGMNYFVLTQTIKQAHVVYDQQKTNGVSAIK